MAPNTKTEKMVKVALVAIFLRAIILFSLNRRTPAAQTTEHPYIAPDDVKSETCLTCHPNKKEGKSVHSALEAGCTNCHPAISESGKTTIILPTEGGSLCAKCHEVSKDPVQHGPYKAGQCMVCHEPHSSDFPKQTRADSKTLCMSCHGTNRPDVKVNPSDATVSLLGGRIFELESYEKAPKVAVGHSERNRLGAANQPMIGKDSRQADAEFNCLSCHRPHAGKAGHLLRNAAEDRDAAKKHHSSNRGGVQCQFARAATTFKLSNPSLGGRL